MAGLSEQVRKKDTYTSPDGRYAKLDEFYLQAAHLEANGQAITSSRIRLMKGRSRDYAGVTIKSFGESSKPNTRRMYYVLTRLESFRGENEYDKSGFVPAIDPSEVNYDAGFLIRLGYADKQNQLEFLHALTGKSHQQLRREGAGSI